MNWEADQSSEKQAKAEARAAAMGAAAGVSAAALIGFAKSEGMSKEELLAYLSTKWDRFDETVGRFGSVLEDFARSVGLHDEQQPQPTARTCQFFEADASKGGCTELAIPGLLYCEKHKPRRAPSSSPR